MIRILPACSSAKSRPLPSCADSSPVGDARPETKLDNCNAGGGAGVAGAGSGAGVLVLPVVLPHPAAKASTTELMIAAHTIDVVRDTTKDGMAYMDSSAPVAVTRAAGGASHEPVIPITLETDAGNSHLF